MEESRNHKKILSEEIILSLKLVKDPPFQSSRGRPKEHKRILHLYEKLLQKEKKQVY